jgi:hypothetical protein
VGTTPPPHHETVAGATALPSGPGATSPTTSTSTTTATVATGGQPVLTSLDPAAGTPSESIVISGRGFLSPDGQIVARFDGQVVPTRCPVPTSCTVTVPALPAAPPTTASPVTAAVTITTASGTSNALAFTYG